MKKTAYITGGSQGIGYGIAAALLREDHAVAISGRNLTGLENAKKELMKIAPEIIILESDVSNYENESHAVQQIVDRFGQLDVVIANAGVGIFKPVDQLELEDWKAMIDTNLTGAFHTLKASVEHLKKSQGYYISIASLAGTNFFETAAGYNASKFGVTGFTQAAMLDLRKYNIKVSTIMPGSVATFFNNHIPSEEDAWKIQPEDIGQMVVDLLKMNPRTLPSKIEVRPTLPGKK